MPLFEYKVAAPDGSISSGRAESDDADALARRLQADGQTPIQIRPSRAAGSSGAGPGLLARLQPQRLTRKDVDFITLELATLLRAGLPLARALDTLKRLSDRPPVTELIDELAADIRSGSALSTALDKRPAVFDRFYRNMVRAGETAGALDLTLERLADFRSRSRAMRETLISALIYPAILVVLAIGALVIMLTVVVPRFTAMFAEAGRELPWLTQLVVSAGDFMQHWWWLLLALLLAAGYGLRQQWQQPAGRLRIEAGLLAAPVLGGLLRRIEAARFTRTLATLLRNGVTLLTAMDIAKEVVTNSVIAQGIAGVARRIRQGEGLAIPLAEAAVLPPLTTQLLKVGEETGRLEPMLEELADIHEQEVETGLKRLLALAEPVIILLIAGFITVIILAIVMAVIETNNLAL
jgi:general secretion pathway protein F